MRLGRRTRLYGQSRAFAAKSPSPWAHFDEGADEELWSASHHSFTDEECKELARKPITETLFLTQPVLLAPQTELQL